MSAGAGGGRFAGRVAIVTGGGGNIGRATARRLAAEGAAVTVADLAEAAAAAVVAEIEEAGGVARPQRVDVADPDAVAALVRDTVDAYAGLDILHNNAAAISLNGKDQDVVTMDLDTWRTVLDVNLTGPMLGCRFAIPAMLERGGGVIVNTASVAAFYGSRALAAYGTSKAGLVALTRYVATAYGDRGIRCNAVAPGVVVDQATQDALGGPMGDALRRYTTSHLVGRLGYPDEIAAAVAYLASDDGAFVTGETLRVDGGMTAHSPSYTSDGNAS
jgi:NAD(P)-dependent dehydrogenase (short-subunit alcohol dehydrogenase family)